MYSDYSRVHKFHIVTNRSVKLAKVCVAKFVFMVYNELSMTFENLVRYCNVTRFENDAAFICLLLKINSSRMFVAYRKSFIEFTRSYLITLFCVDRCCSLVDGLRDA